MCGYVEAWKNGRPLRRTISEQHGVIGVILVSEPGRAHYDTYGILYIWRESSQWQYRKELEPIHSPVSASLSRLPLKSDQLFIPATQQISSKFVYNFWHEKAKRNLLGKGNVGYVCIWKSRRAQSSTLSAKFFFKNRSLQDHLFPRTFRRLYGSVV